jgi:hypothetical protein
VNLAFARFVIFAVIALRFSTETYVAFAQLPRELLRPPIGMGWALPLVPLEPEGVRALALVLRLSAVAAALGLATRVSTVLATLAAGLFFAIPHLFGHVGHDRHHLIWFAALLAASPCGDRLSLDALWRRFRRGPAEAPPGPAVRYGFPLRAILLVMGAAYFFSGFWKLASIGVGWFWSDSLNNLAAKLAWAGLGGHPDVIRRFPWLAPVGGLGTVAFELGFVFLVVSSRAGRIVALVAAFAFHIGTFFLLGISFGHLLYCYLGLIDVAGLARRFGLARAEANRPEPSRVALPMRATALVVIGGVALFGALRVGNGWPFACYPRFDVRHTPRVTSYVVEGRGPSGERLRLHDGELGGPLLGRHFYNLLRANQARVAGLEDADGREPRWRAACTFLWGHHPALRDATAVRFLLDDVDVSADGGHGRILRERELFACAPPSEKGR